MIAEFLNQNHGTSSDDINKKAQNLTDILLSTANLSLHKPKYKKKKSNKKRKNWFDNNLFKMRSNLISLGKLYAKFPKDPYIKGKYYRNYRLYNKSRKAKYKEFMNSMFDKLEKLQSENPKHYWQLVNDIKGLSKNDSSSQIDSETWVNHFRNLHSSIDGTFQNRISELENILKQKEKTVIFNELDFEIKDKEISEAISKLKSGKAVGPDLISNEMLKHSQKHIIPCLKILFNLCFQNGIFPKIWADGFICPIYKADDPNDPAYYRGITITSTIGKVFNNILNNRLDTFLKKTQSYS